MDDLSWILADGESLEDALEEFERDSRVDNFWIKEYAKLGTDPYRTPEQKQREDQIDGELG
tara:strand:- start:155 stop:337 length:183 start_codon:yes stop_codon:yes gene_type:complete